MNLAVSVSQKSSFPFMWLGSEKCTASLGNLLWSAANHLSPQTEAFKKNHDWDKITLGLSLVWFVEKV